MRKIGIADPHGNYLGIESILKKVSYSPNDLLFLTGDYCDHFPNKRCDVKKTVDLLLSLSKDNPKVYPIMGNHDMWLREWILSRVDAPEDVWYSQGGKETLKDYNPLKNQYFLKVPYIDYEDTIPKEHVKFFTSLVPFYIDDEIVVVHGGFASRLDMIEVLKNKYHPSDLDKFENILWDREFYREDRLWKEYTKIFGNRYCIMGHTPRGILWIDNKILLDCGSGGGGKLCGIVIENRKIQFVEE